MADGRHLGFRFWAIISASINIFAPNFTPRWKIGSPRGPSAQKSDFRKSKMADVSNSFYKVSVHSVVLLSFTFLIVSLFFCLFCSLLLFSRVFYSVHILKLRPSGFGLHVGSLFIGCVLYVGDIVRPSLV